MTYWQLVKESEECFGSVTSVTRNMWFRRYRKAMSGRYEYPRRRVIWMFTLVMIGVSVMLIPLIFVLAFGVLGGGDLLGIPRYISVAVYAGLTFLVAYGVFRYAVWPVSYDIFLRYGFIVRRAR